ncbi:RicAFT regulatory complex protein RicA family protein [Paenibacillus swuensis]|nr:YlbF family regulator [Paenibacillus swuensis]
MTHQHGEHECSMEHYTNTEMVVREDILAKTKELAALISTSDEVSVYQKAEAQINANERIQVLISSIKKKQKEIVAFQTFKNEKMIAKIEGEIEALQDELDGIPIVAQFQQTQTDLNYLLQLIFSVIRDTVSDKITVEESTAPVSSSCSE